MVGFKSELAQSSADGASEADVLKAARKIDAFETHTCSTIESSDSVKRVGDILVRYGYEYVRSRDRRESSTGCVMV